MPSQLHESHLFLFQNQPSLAAELMRDALGVKLPRYRHARLASADLTDIQPAEYRADMVVHLCDDDAAVYAIILEVQLSEDDRKRFVWPAYVTNLRARLECPVSLLVVTPHERVARWASRCVEIGGLHQFTPYVLGPSGVPVVTDERVAQRNPELAVLSAMAHGRTSDVTRAIEIAVAAQGAVGGLDSDRSRIYLDLIMNSVGEAARCALNAMDPRKYVFQSDFARHYIALGKAEGIEEGRAEGRMEERAALISRLLAIRFGTLDPEIQGRIQRATPTELEVIGDRVLTARSLEEALGLS
jgi:hypothetical protein